MYVLMLCVCCTGWMTNRDDSGCKNSCAANSHGIGLMADASHFNSIVLNWDDFNDDYDVIDFSNAACDGCGSRLAGTRFVAAGYLR